MIGTGVTLIPAWAWLEEIADLVPGYIFDKWDLAVIYLGFLLGCTMLQRLSYPVFDAYPPYRPCPHPASIRLDDITRLLCAAYVFAYTALTDPSPYGDRWSHIAELTALILGATYLLNTADPVPKEPRAEARGLAT